MDEPWIHSTVLKDLAKSILCQSSRSLLLAVLLPGILFPQKSHFCSSGKNGKSQLNWEKLQVTSPV